MNSNTIRQIEMLRRVKDFGIARASDFAETSLARKQFNTLTEKITTIEGYGADQLSGLSTAQNLAATKDSLRQELRDLLSNINRTARVMAPDTPEFDAKFRMPRQPTDLKLLTAARSFLQDAIPLKDRFIEHEMPADFLEQLAHLADEFDKAISQKSSAVGSHVSTRLTLEETVSAGLGIVRQLDAIVRNKYHGDPVTLAMWQRASHVAKRTRTSEEEPPAKEKESQTPETLEQADKKDEK